VKCYYPVCVNKIQVISALIEFVI